MVLGNNRIGFLAHRNWMLHNNKMNTSLERLSSGFRINRASDDPSGHAVSEKIKAQLTMLEMEKQDSSYKLSRLEITDGMMSGMQQVLDRMHELAELSKNGTFSDQERKHMNTEYQLLKDELSRLGGGSRFHSIPLYKDGPTSKGESSDFISVSYEQLNQIMDEVDDFLRNVSTASRYNDSDLLLSYGIDRSNGKTDKENLKDALTNYIKQRAGEIKNNSANGSDGGPQYTVAFDNGDISFHFPELNADSLGLAESDILSSENAGKAIQAVLAAKDMVSSSRGDCAAMQSRLEHQINNLDQMNENLSRFLSRIIDTDVAKEMINYMKEKSLSQMSMFVMAHVNQDSDIVLKLLKEMN